MVKLYDVYARDSQGHDWVGQISAGGRRRAWLKACFYFWRYARPWELFVRRSV